MYITPVLRADTSNRSLNVTGTRGQTSRSGDVTGGVTPRKYYTSTPFTDPVRPDVKTFEAISYSRLVHRSLGRRGWERSGYGGRPREPLSPGRVVNGRTPGLIPKPESVSWVTERGWVFTSNP